MINEFTNKVTNLIKEVEEKETQNIKKAAKIMYDAMMKEQLVHVFATGHSHMFAEEMFYRSGGLVQIDPILIPELMQHEGAVSSTKKERIEGKAKLIFDNWDIKDTEPIIIISNSGINAVPVEMALISKEHKCPVIVITSLESSKELTPRNKAGFHLYELGDVVISNHTPYGDGIIDKEYGNIGSVSSIVGSYIAQCLVLEIVSMYETNNLIPPIYVSANIPGGDEHNIKLMDKYKLRIKCLY